MVVISNCYLILFLLCYSLINERLRQLSNAAFLRSFSINDGSHVLSRHTKICFFSVVLFSLFYDVDNEFLLLLVFAPISSSVSVSLHSVTLSNGPVRVEMRFNGRYKRLKGFNELLSV